MGPVCAAAVILPEGVELEGVNDSKKLSEKKRCELAETIRNTPGSFWAVASASPAEIDSLNILRATHLAMRRAALQLAEKAQREDFSILVDGLAVPTLPFPSRNLVKGDAKSLFIAAASILAKTERDADCLRLDAIYPEYGFARHKGYPTKEHFAALAKFGPCPEHRRSFGPVSQMELPL
jgi:ribonuclease HII